MNQRTDSNGIVGGNSTIDAETEAEADDSNMVQD